MNRGAVPAVPLDFLVQSCYNEYTVRLAFTVAYGRDITGSQDSYDKTW